jgi:hypothetical protein
LWVLGCNIRYNNEPKDPVAKSTAGMISRVQLVMQFQVERPLASFISIPALFCRAFLSRDRELFPDVFEDMCSNQLLALGQSGNDVDHVVLEKRCGSCWAVSQSK